MAPVKQPVDLIEEVADRIGVDYDFPYCFYLDVEGDQATLVFGYANDSLGYNLTTKDGGEVLYSGELADEGVPIERQGVDEQVLYIRKYCMVYKAVGVEPLEPEQIAYLVEDGSWECPECHSFDVEVNRYNDGRAERLTISCCDCDWEVEA